MEREPTAAYIKTFTKKYRKKGAILFGKWLERLDEQGLNITDSADDSLDANLLIDDVLEAMAFFVNLQEGFYYDIEPDQRPRAQLCIRKIEDKIIAIWHKNKQALSEEFDVEYNFLIALHYFEKIVGPSAEILAKLFANEVLHGQLQLPGYKNLSQGSDSICLTRLESSVQRELEKTLVEKASS